MLERQVSQRSVTVRELDGKISPARLPKRAELLVPRLFHRLGALAADIRADMFQPLALWPMVHVFVYSIPSSHPLM